MKIPIVSNEEAEKCDLVVCVRKTSPVARVFDDNEEGPCCKCGETVVWRPYMPKKPPRICMECALAGKGEVTA